MHFFAHQENILLAMVADQNPSLRRVAVTMIQKIRQSQQIGVRLFKVPKLNFHATSYNGMVVLDTLATEPPLTTSVIQEDLAGFCGKTFTAEFPRHTQSVERAVKLVSDTSKMVFGHERRDGQIKVTLKSRKQMPVFDTKKDFRL